MVDFDEEKAAVVEDQGAGPVDGEAFEGVWEEAVPGELPAKGVVLGLLGWGVREGLRGWVLDLG